MRIKMRVGLSGSLNGVPYPPAGTEWDVTDEGGRKLCEKGMAVPVAVVGGKVETAVAPDAEVRRGPGRPSKTDERRRPSDGAQEGRTDKTADDKTTELPAGGAVTQPAGSGGALADTDYVDRVKRSQEQVLKKGDADPREVVDKDHVEVAGGEVVDPGPDGPGAGDAAPQGPGHPAAG